jgi:hypothetical protein
MATVEEHEKKVADAQAALDKAKQNQAKEAEAAANPRPVGNIVLDVVRWLIGRAGNHPVAEKLLHELEAATGQVYDPESGEYKPAPAPAAPAAEEPAKD